MTLTNCFEILIKNHRVVLDADELQRAAMVMLENYRVVQKVPHLSTLAYQLNEQVGIDINPKGYTFHVPQNTQQAGHSIVVEVNDQLFTAHKEPVQEKTI